MAAINQVIRDIKLKLKEQVNRPKLCLIDGDDKRIEEVVEQLEDLEVIVINSNLETTINNQEKNLTIHYIKPQIYDEIINIVIEKTKDYKKPFSKEMLEEWSLNPVQFAMILLKSNLVDCVIGGASYPTADIISPILKLIKAKENITTISSYMLLEKKEEILIFADCALNIDPTEEQLLEIAKETIVSAKQFNIDPQVAMLSYSTNGSAQGDSAIKVRNVAKKLQKDFPNKIYGEIQFDAAYDYDVCKKKLNIETPKQANVYIFPDLNSGNIGYKIAQYLGDYQAIGPFIQGVNLPVNDLSRGASVDDIIKTIYITLNQLGL